MAVEAGRVFALFSIFLSFPKFVFSTEFFVSIISPVPPFFHFALFSDFFLPPKILIRWRPTICYGFYVFVFITGSYQKNDSKECYALRLASKPVGWFMCHRGKWFGSRYICFDVVNVIHKAFWCNYFLVYFFIFLS